MWYGIGILYDRYGSFDHAEEAFTAVLKMDPKFEKANEIYFRLGIIYKQQQKYEQSLKCFRYILGNPPRPLVQGDIYFQIGHVHELKKDVCILHCLGFLISLVHSFYTLIFILEQIRLLFSFFQTVSFCQRCL